jgi:hypothetical protein
MPLESHGDLHVLCLNENIVPQSNVVETMIDGGSKANDVILNNVTCDAAKTTCFVEDESIVRSDFKLGSIANDYEVRYETIKDFLGKPYLLNTLQWTSASAENTNLYNVSIGSLLNSVSPWELKIRGFELIRGTFNVRVQLNCSPFQAGRLILHYLPNYADRILLDPGFGARYNTLMIQKFQHPHIDLDARDSVALMSIPYIAPSAYYDLKEDTYDWGTLFLDVVSPFKSGASGTLNAEITIFGYWSDIELAAPIVPQANGKERTKSFRTSKNIENAESPGVIGSISSGLRSVGRAASNLSEIPILAPVMGTVSWAANCASQVASIFGWSKPRTNDPPMIMARQPFRYSGTGDAPDVSQPTTLFHDNATKVTTDYSIRSQDEMSLKYLLKVPTYMGRVTWTTAQATGTQLTSRQLAPRLLYTAGTKTTGGHIHSFNCGAPLYYLSNFFGLYRGSFTLHLKFVKTIFHSGKILITYSPIINETTAPTTSTSIYSLREIVDIREQSEVTLNFPYMVHRTYLNPSQQMGIFRIFVLNDLRCPETVAQEVDMLVFVTAGDDFEYQAPTGNLGDSNGAFTPQSDNTETIVNTGIAESAIKGASTMYSEKCIGEHFCSVKQLLNRNSQLQPFNTLAYASDQITLFPWFASGYSDSASTGLMNAPIFQPDAYSIISPMYNYYRGKARVMVVSDAANNIQFSNLPYQNYTYSTTSPLDTTSANALLGKNTAVTQYTVSKKIVPFQTPVPTGSHIGAAFQQVPYYNKYPVSFVQLWTGEANNFYLDETQPASSAVFTAGTNFGTTTVIERSFADDFQLSFFIGCPPLYISST